MSSSPAETAACSLLHRNGVPRKLLPNLSFPRRSRSMQTILSRWLMFGLLIGWSLSHAAVFAQPVKTGPADKIRQGLDKVISADYNGQSLSDAINHMREKSGLRINIDQASIMQMGMN